MKSALILSALFIFTQCKKEQPDIVDIPGDNFLNALIQKGIDTDGNGIISSEEAAGVSSLDISGKDISDITGIESFINLDTSNCLYNIISYLDVWMNTNLIFLECGQNRLTSLDVSKNLALSTLRCGV